MGKSSNYAGIDPATKHKVRKYLGTFPSKRAAEKFRAELAHHPLYSAGIGSAGSPPMIQALYTRLITERGLASATVKQAASILHAALSDAERQGIIMKNPADQCTAPSVPDHLDLEVWTEEQLDAYLADAVLTTTASVLAFYVAMLATGCRPGELAGTPEDAINFERQALHVRTNLVKAGREPVFDEPKTRAGYRTIKLPPEAVELIRAALLWKKQRRLKLGPKFRDGGTLFCTPRGRPLDRRVLRARDHLPRIRRLNLPDARIYDLRHLNITYAIAEGVDPVTVASRVGHKDVGYMMRRYAHPVRAAQERAVEVCSTL